MEAYFLPSSSQSRFFRRTSDRFLLFSFFFLCHHTKALKSILKLPGMIRLYTYSSTRILNEVIACLNRINYRFFSHKIVAKFIRAYPETKYGHIFQTDKTDISQRQSHNNLLFCYLWQESDEGNRFIGCPPHQCFFFHTVTNKNKLVRFVLFRIQSRKIQYLIKAIGRTMSTGIENDQFALILQLPKNLLMFFRQRRRRLLPFLPVYAIGNKMEFPFVEPQRSHVLEGIRQKGNHGVSLPIRASFNPLKP